MEKIVDYAQFLMVMILGSILNIYGLLEEVGRCPYRYQYVIGGKPLSISGSQRKSSEIRIFFKKVSRADNSFFSDGSGSPASNRKRSNITLKKMPIAIHTRYD
jgi:hypothetical protein